MNWPTSSSSPPYLLDTPLPDLPRPELRLWTGPADRLVATLLGQPAGTLYLTRDEQNRLRLGQVTTGDPRLLRRALCTHGPLNRLVVILGLEDAAERAVLLRIMHQTLAQCGAPLGGNVPPGLGLSPARYARLRALAGALLLELLQHEVLPLFLCPADLMAGPRPLPVDAATRRIAEAGQDMMSVTTMGTTRAVPMDREWILLAGSDISIDPGLCDDPVRSDLPLPEIFAGRIVHRHGWIHRLTEPRPFPDLRAAAHFALGRTASTKPWRHFAGAIPTPSNVSTPSNVP